MADQIPPELLALPQYEVRRLLGGGGMGVVYLAYNKYMKRFEALKVINKDLLEQSGVAERFLREIGSAGQLDHANVVRAHAAFPAGRLLVFVMEYVEGEDLAQVVASSGPLPVDQACNYAYQAAQGLQHAHEKGMVHRDIKPHNLILLRIRQANGVRPVVKILDFGLAKAVSEQPTDGGLTGSHAMLGTPHYIAPEQALDAQKADIRADIYSLGCTLYHLLAGRPPFRADSMTAILLAHQSAIAPPLDQVRSDVPAELAAIVVKMMAKNPRDRYQTPAEVARALISLSKLGAAAASVPSPPSLAPAKPPAPTILHTVAEPRRYPQPEQLVSESPPVWPWVLVGVMGLSALVLLLWFVLGPGRTSAWQGTQPGAVHVVRVQDQSIRFRWCPPGSFQMGSPKGEKGRGSDEDPVNVTLTRGFWLMESEVTQGLWQAAGGIKLDWSVFGGSPELPVYNVSHAESKAFATKLTQLLQNWGQLPSGMKLALPAEAQWEYAVRAGTTTRFCFGEDESKLGESAWYEGNSSSQVHSVGLKLPNSWGLLDMAGNVWEWCADGYGDRLSAGANPSGPSRAPLRVIRGGSWYGDARNCRSADRFGSRPDYRSEFLGFRLAAVQE